MKFQSAAASLLVALTALFTTTAHAVENTWDYAVRVSATVQTSPAAIALSWPQDTNGVPASYAIARKAPGASSWTTVTTLPGSATSYTDTGITAGTAYEYRITKAAGSYTGYGYIQTGVGAPLVDRRGKVLLIVDQTFTTSLGSELARLQRDLVGDGWTVIRHDVSRTDSPASVKNLIRTAYNADPANVKSVFLFGRVPVPYSGDLFPDGHSDHRGAWPADVYYGDVDGNWTDSSVNYTQSINTDPADAARLTNRPGDGKFDQTQIPSAVELEVGRVDLANMPGRTTWGGPATFKNETELLRQYLNKDHNFRHRVTNPARRAILGDYFGARGGEAFAASGFRSFAPLVGASNIRNLNTENNDQRGVWIGQAAAADYLLAYGCGAGSYTSISGLGNSGPYYSGNTVEMVSNNVRGVFNMLFGSWLGDWDHEDSILRSPLATGHGLAAMWSGRPHWFMHPMGLGETIGYITRLSQNNNGLYQTQVNSSANRIHVALMGDPTLRLHPVAPAGNLIGGLSGTTVALTWQASSDSNIVGYHVYRAASANGPFTRLTSSPVTALNYSDLGAPAGSTYMVRAIKLESAPSGSYYNASQGVFYTMGSSGGTTTAPAPTSDATAPAIAISAPASGATIAGSAVTISANATDGVGVTGVQFKLDGANLGGEDTSAPFSTTLDTTKLANGTHTLGAVARDAAGNFASATPVSVTVSNPTASAGDTTAGNTTTEGTTTSDPTTAPSSSTSTIAGTTIWFDDALPAGAQGSGSGGENWNWISSNPAPISGTRAHQSIVAAGLHGHSFNWAAPLTVNAGDVLVTYVYLDPANMPTEIMLAWAAGNWEHRAYWGADNIGYGKKGTAGRYYAGPLPAGGQWVRLEVPASAVALEGQQVAGMSFLTYDGRATFDAVGKALPGSTTSTTTTPTTSTPTSTSGTAVDSIWVDDSLPPGASGSGSGGENWNWVTSNPAPTSGTRAHQSILAAGLHGHSFNWASAMTVNSGDVLVTYVYLDPANMPTEIMLAWAAGSWEHRAYWGTDKINYGAKGTAGRYYAGSLPAGGQWARLEVPASAVALEGQQVVGMSFLTYDGRATWDKSGKSTAGTTTTPTTSSTTPTTSSPTPTTSGTSTATTTTSVTDTVWFDDALPNGASGGATGGDGWNWVSTGPAPVSGLRAHQSNIAAGLHEHFFNWASAPMKVASGEKLFVYVYIDPANPTSEIMLSWNNGTWEHRAYWGANRINYGTNNTAGRFYAGALPAAGQWARLEVPASAVGLEGSAVKGMCFSTFDGRVTYDKIGQAAVSTSTTPTTTSTTTSTTTTAPTTSTGTEWAWSDDALPAGATGIGNGETWNWITSGPTPYSGTKAHQSALAAGLHEHYFAWGAAMSVAAGDTLYTYVYLDPASPPTEIMLSWNDGSWEHRAYWGADKISYGKPGTAGRYYAGALPPAGQWVRIEVPASAVGLEGRTATAMCFSTFDGRVTYDKTGKISR